MITYVLSQHTDSWHIHRFAENISEIAAAIATEEDAVSIVLERAMADRPSRILRISINGDSRLLAEFGEEPKDEPGSHYPSMPGGGSIRYHLPGLF
jgi:hypothetical protein